MRNLIYAMICIFTIASCSEPDTDVEIGISDTTSSRAPLGPHNDSNPYDLAGKLHYDILELYIPLESDFATMQSIISLTDSLATNDGRFTSLATGTYSIPISTRINAILSDPEGVYTALSASISPLAITTVKNFCTDVVALYTTNADYDDAYLYITSYEDAIILSGFTSKEKEVMLTTASIARYSLWLSSRQKKRKPRDRDWDTLFTALTAGVEGATSSTANAIMMSVATAAAGNQ